MEFSDAFLDEAQHRIIQTVNDLQPELLSKWGAGDPNFKADRSVVTEMDLTLDSYLIQRLTELDPTIGFLTEETGAIGDQEVRWLIDSIDGTEQYVRGVRGCVSMVSLLIKNDPQLTVIYDFIDNVPYTAQTGKGAFAGGKPVCVSERPLDRAWVEASYDRKNMPVEALVALNGACEVVRMKAGVNMFNGKIDGIVSIGGKGKIWDYAPRMHMIREAGGYVGNIGTGKFDITSNTFIASNRVIYPKLQAILSDKV